MKKKKEFSSILKKNPKWFKVNSLFKIGFGTFVFDIWIYYDSLLCSSVSSLPENSTI